MDKGTRHLFAALSGQVSTFLEMWAVNMEKAGYLEHTTAKVEDCILSFQWFLEPILEARASPRPDFAGLIRDPAWADKMLQTARRHRGRGVTAEMFVGCFKTLVHAVEETAAGLAPDQASRATMLGYIRLYADACETLIIHDWFSMSEQEARSNLDRANRLLTLEKNKLENIVSSISDLVLVVDQTGMLIQANTAARQHLGASVSQNRPVWEILGLEGESMEDVVHYYPMDQSHELAVHDSALYLNLKIIPLSAVSLASRGYLLVLNDITFYVTQRSILEQNVLHRTEELRREKVQVEEMVITLRNVMQTMEQSRAEQMDQLSANIEKELLPALARIRQETDPHARQHHVDLFQDRLLGLFNLAGPRQDARLLCLTPAEARICQFVQAGKSSKDIASALNISLGTVQTHRKNIRKKIGLRGKVNNLFTFLQSSLDHTPAPPPHPQ